MLGFTYSDGALALEKVGGRSVMDGMVCVSSSAASKQRLCTLLHGVSYDGGRRNVDRHI